jgi:hypothetical protein
MPINLASPGIKVREVDLTLGRVDPSSEKIGGLVAPFAQGPVDLPTLVGSEKDLLDNFGKPYGNDKHYEHWLTASSYLAYGAPLRVVRQDDDNLYNAYVGSGSSIKIKSIEHYEQLQYDENVIANKTIVAKNPGSWANGIRIGIIDAKADQVLTGISTTGVSAFTAAITNRSATIATGAATTIGIVTTSIALGQEIRGGFVSAGTTVIGISTNTDTITISQATTNTEGVVTVPLDFGTTTFTAVPLVVGAGITQSMGGRFDVGAGTTTALTGHLKGIVTEVGVGQVSVKVLSYVDGATETVKDYQEGGTWAFTSTGSVAIHTADESVSYGSTVYTGRQDWFSQQTVAISTSTVGGSTVITTQPWNTLADRPGTSQYVADRGGRFDEVHVVVIDGDGKVTGNAGTILEKHLGLSKAKDAEFSVGSPSYWRSYLKSNSAYIFGGDEPAGTTPIGYSSGFTRVTQGAGAWDKDAKGVIFNGVGDTNLVLISGRNYEGKTDITSTGALASDVSKLSTGYALFENTETYAIDFLIMGSANYSSDMAAALANKLIAVADVRKDALAFVSPYRGAFLTDTESGTVTVNNDETITNNILEFYSKVSSSSYGVLDSGYKYMFDRFANTFRYVPLNGDIAGLCARNDIDNFPWFSPAGTTRGAILNAVKLAYNPSQTQRDRLYSARVNPVIVSPGGGIILFGDKTALSRASAFDRINVRRLFIYLEDSISAAARDQLFEFNDEITRTNFVNIVEPFLRDVQAKRGIQDYVVICDETNNTAAIIDNNEFVADIYIKPARSINFIGLTFVATRTGVSFEEVIGNV